MGNAVRYKISTEEASNNSNTLLQLKQLALDKGIEELEQVMKDLEHQEEEEMAENDKGIAAAAAAASPPPSLVFIAKDSKEMTAPSDSRPVVCFDVSGKWTFTIDRAPKFRGFDDFLVARRDEATEITTWALAECTVSGVRALHPEVRLVNKCQKPVYLNCSVLTTFMTKNDLEKVGPVDFLRYDAGCFAARHQDSMGKYTCLVFPKMAARPCLGGELVLYRRDGGAPVVIRPYALPSDTMVVFPADMEHEVKPVAAYERYVFKIGLAAAPPTPAAKEAAREPRRYHCNRD